jgi:hypothetical protein
MNLCRPWPQGSRSGGVVEVADRVCYGGAYGSLHPPPSVHIKHQLSVQKGAMEATSPKKNTTLM